MTFGALFSGYGGLDRGLERAGMTCLWQVEIDDDCRAVLAKHWPHIKQHSDIRTIKGEDLEQVDVLAGGFPCQDVSSSEGTTLREGDYGFRLGWGSGEAVPVEQHYMEGLEPTKTLLAFRRKRGPVGYMYHIVDAPIIEPGKDLALGMRNKCIAHWHTDDPNIVWLRCEEIFK